MRSSASVGLALGAGLAAVVVACAAGPTAATAPAASPPTATVSAMPGDPRSEIQRLANDIAGRRDQLHLPAPQIAEPTESDCKPTCMIEQMAVAPSAQDNTCHPAPSQSCHDVCNLADSICDDAAQICKLAKQLATDPWAAGKCSEAQKSCTDAHGHCCGCT